MSDDIVTRLRQEVARAENDGRLLSWELAKCAWTAADEIERLRSVSAMLTDEIERLRADRDRWKEIAVHLTAPCDDQECYYRPLAHGAAADHLRQTIRKSARQ